MKCVYCGQDVADNLSQCPYCKNSFKFTDDLIKKAISGEQNAISDLYNLTYNNIYHTVKSMIHDEDTVLDIVQDSYIKAFRNLEQLGSPGYFNVWLRRIAINQTKDYLKKKKPILFSELVDDDSELDFRDERKDHLPEQIIDEKETSRLINEILGSLSEEQRLVIGMYYYEQFSVKEISDIIGCSENTIKSRLNYGRKKIEAKVLELEKNGTKLYSLAPMPFLLLLFRNMGSQVSVPSATVLKTIHVKCAIDSTIAAVEATAAQSTIGSTVTEKAVDATTRSDGIGATVAKETAKKVAKKGVKSTISSVTKSVTAKIIAGAMVASVATGGTVAAVYESNKNAVATSSETTITETATPTIAPDEILELDLSPYISVRYTGFDGEAVATFDFLQSDFESYAKSQWASDANTQEKTDALTELSESIRFEEPFLRELSNGDTYTVTLTYDSDLADMYGYKLTGVEKTFTVDGLKKEIEYKYKAAYRQIIEFAETVYDAKTNEDAVGYYLHDIDLNGIPELIVTTLNKEYVGILYNVFSYDEQNNIAFYLSDLYGNTVSSLYYDKDLPGIYVKVEGYMYFRGRKYDLVNGELSETEAIEYPNDQIFSSLINLERYEIDNLTPLETE